MLRIPAELRPVEKGSSPFFIKQIKTPVDQLLGKTFVRLKTGGADRHLHHGLPANALLQFFQCLNIFVGIRQQRSDIGIDLQFECKVPCKQCLKKRSQQYNEGSPVVELSDRAEEMKYSMHGKK